MDGHDEHTAEDNEFGARRYQIKDDVPHFHVLLSWQGRSAHVGFVIRLLSRNQIPTAKQEIGSGFFVFVMTSTQIPKNQGGKENVKQRIRNIGASCGSGKS